jgi:hypothetical protein
MSSSWLRRSSRVVAAILLLAAFCQLPHRSQNDEFCAPTPEAHDESKHVFTTVAEADHADHCAICHWTRWLKPVFASGSVAPVTCDAGANLAASTEFPRRDPSTDQLPPRAPPSRLLL